MSERIDLRVIDRAYADPRVVVRYLRDHIADGLARELSGLNEQRAVAALEYAEDRLANALQVVRLCLAEQNRREAEDGDEDEP